MGRLENKVAIITGGDGDIGLATARLFLDEGASLLITGHREAMLEAAKEELAAGDRVETLAADVTLEADTIRTFAKADERFGGVDVLFSNAGTEGKIGPLADYELADFETILKVNLTGTFLSLKHGMQALTKRGGGSIVVCSSILGVMGIEGMAAYSASKHALTGLVQVAALEGAKQGIRVNSVNPSMVEGRMMRSIEDGSAPGHADAVKTMLEARVPLGRYAKPEEVGRLVLFLACDDSSYITNSVYKIDGGLSFY